MIGALVIFFALIWVLTGEIRLKRKKERILRDKNVETVTFIQFDGRSVKIYDRMTLVSVAGLVISSTIAEFMEPVVGLLVMVFVGMLIISVPSWLIGKSYLNRLKKMGYEIPWRSKDYDYILENVPKTRENFEPEEHKEYKEYNKRSMVFAIIYGYIWLCMLAVNVWICCKWRFNSGVEMFGFLAVVDIYWVIRALQFCKQMNNEKYKEDIEVDPNRKNRIGLEHAVVELLVMLLVVCGAKNLISNFMNAAYRAQLDADRGWMRTIHAALDISYRELVEPGVVNDNFFTPEELKKDWSRSRQQLMEGVDITEWGVPQDVYQKKIAEELFISNFAELEKYFNAVDEDAVLIAKIENGVLSLSLSNLKRKADAPLVIESETPLPQKN